MLLQHDHPRHAPSTTPSGGRSRTQIGSVPSAHSTTWPFHMLAAILIAFLLLGLGYGWNRVTLPAQTIRGQLQLIDEGMYLQAYGYLSPSARNNLALDEFVAAVQHNHVVMEVRSSTLHSHIVNGITATVTGTLDGYGPEVSDVTYTLIKQEGRWTIATFNWSPPHVQP